MRIATAQSELPSLDLLHRLGLVPHFGMGVRRDFGFGARHHRQVQVAVMELQSHCRLAVGMQVVDRSYMLAAVVRLLVEEQSRQSHRTSHRELHCRRLHEV